MKIGVPREIKTEEYRVGMTPLGVKMIAARGHRVLVESGAGVGSGFSDEEYAAVGAEIARDADEIYGSCEIIVKVKEPQEAEIERLRPGQILFTYLHLAGDKLLTERLLAKHIIGVAYETVEMADGSLPLLTPMSEIAGRLSVQEGAKYLEKPFGGRGILLGGVPGIRRGTIAILGGGVVGTNACKVAVGLGAEVFVLDISSKRLSYLDDIFATRITTLYSNESNIAEVLRHADLVIGAVLVHGAAAPRLIHREHLTTMKRGAVIVDVAVDQGGCCDTSRPSTHKDPVYIVDGVVHYTVPNMPSAVALSSTIALTSVTYPYVLQIAEKGIRAAVRENAALARGVNLWEGHCTYEGVAESLNLPLAQLDNFL